MRGEFRLSLHQPAGMHKKRKYFWSNGYRTLSSSWCFRHSLSCKFNGAEEPKVQHKHSSTSSAKFASKDKNCRSNFKHPSEANAAQTDKSGSDMLPKNSHVRLRIYIYIKKVNEPGKSYCTGNKCQILLLALSCESVAALGMGALK